MDKQVKHHDSLLWTWRNPWVETNRMIGASCDGPKPEKQKTPINSVRKASINCSGWPGRATGSWAGTAGVGAQFRENLYHVRCSNPGQQTWMMHFSTVLRLKAMRMALKPEGLTGFPNLWSYPEGKWLFSSSSSKHWETMSAGSHSAWL